MSLGKIDPRALFSPGDRLRKVSTCLEPYDPRSLELKKPDVLEPLKLLETFDILAFEAMNFASNP